MNWHIQQLQSIVPKLIILVSELTADLLLRDYSAKSGNVQNPENV